MFQQIFSSTNTAGTSKKRANCKNVQKSTIKYFLVRELMLIIKSSNLKVIHIKCEVLQETLKGQGGFASDLITDEFERQSEILSEALKKNNKTKSVLKEA